MDNAIAIGVLGIPAPDKPAKPAAWSGQAIAGFDIFCLKRRHTHLN
jgi:hypothetical protein